MNLEQKVVLLENFRLELNEKIQLLLLLAGEKHAVDIPLPTSASRATTLMNLIDKLGLATQIVSTESADMGDDSFEPQILCVAGSSEDLAGIVSVWSQPKGNHGVESEVLHGKLSGFPDTAIAAFSHGNLLPFDEQEEVTKDLDYYYFVQMRLSKNNWREELEAAKRWAHTIESLSPSLYKQCQDVEFE